MDPTTRFDEEEIRRILARAADRQHQADRLLPNGTSPDSDEPSVTLADLQEAAQAAGIDASHVIAAAREVQLRRDAPISEETWFGIPREIAEFRVVPGALSEEQWERVVGEFRSEFNMQGVTNSFGDTREWWSTSNSLQPIVFRLEANEDGASVTLRRGNRSAIELVGVLGGMFGSMAVIAAGVTAFGIGSLPVAVPVGVGALAAATLGGGSLLARRASRVLGKRFSSLLDRVELIARRDGPV